VDDAMMEKRGLVTGECVFHGSFLELDFVGAPEASMDDEVALDKRLKFAYGMLTYVFVTYQLKVHHLGPPSMDEDAGLDKRFRRIKYYSMLMSRFKCVV
jgi:hypothetical protein